VCSYGHLPLSNVVCSREGEPNTSFLGLTSTEYRPSCHLRMETLHDHPAYVPSLTIYYFIIMPRKEEGLVPHTHPQIR